MSAELNETGARMFAVEKAMQIASTTGSMQADAVVKDAEKILAFVSPPPAAPSRIIGVRQ